MIVWGDDAECDSWASFSITISVSEGGLRPGPQADLRDRIAAASCTPWYTGNIQLNNGIHERFEYEGICCLICSTAGLSNLKCA